MITPQKYWAENKAPNFLPLQGLQNVIIWNNYCNTLLLYPKGIDGLGAVEAYTIYVFPFWVCLVNGINSLTATLDVLKPFLEN